MIKIFKWKFAEMRDIEGAKKEVLERMRKNREEIDNHLRDIRERLAELNKETVSDLNRLNRTVGGIHKIVDDTTKYLSAFADEVFLHLPAKKSNVPLNYHHKRVAKALPVEPVAGAKTETR